MSRASLLRRLLFSFAVWTPYALLYTLQQIVVLRARGGPPISLPHVLGQQAAFFVPWALATPAVIRLGESFPIQRARWLPPLAVHLTAIVAFTALHCVAIVAVESPKDVSGAWESWKGCMTRGMLLLDAFLYLTVSLGGVAIRLRQRHRDRERDVARLEAQLAKAQLRSLEAQLHPHFAFNALNTVAMLIRDNRNAVALRTLVAFSDLLRQFLTREAPMTTLGNELDSVQRYLDIESMRLGDRLHVAVDVASDAQDFEVPSLLLQPLIENAIRHGAGAREGAFHLSVRGCVEAGRLRLTVEDDGPGLPNGWSLESSKGLGLRNISERLRQIYNNDAGFDLARQDGRGLRITIDLPKSPTGVMERP